MRRVGALAVVLVLLGACALPIPVQIASWVIDGVSIIATKKSVTDHGISLIAQKDCALWRGIKGEKFCTEFEDGAFAIVWADYGLRDDEDKAGPAAKVDVAALVEFDDFDLVVIAGPDIEELAAFETAAGPAETADSVHAMEFSEAWAFMQRQSMSDNAPFWASPGPEAEESAEIALSPAPGHRATEFVEAWAFLQGQSVAWLDKPAEPANAKVAETMPLTVDYIETRTVGSADLARTLPVAISSRAEPAAPMAELYYVIGSFSKRFYAERLAGRHSELDPKVMVSSLDGREVNRVVIGPFASDDQPAVHRSVLGAGIYDAWAIRIDPDEWSVVPPSALGDTARGDPEDLAQLP